MTRLGRPRCGLSCSSRTPKKNSAKRLTHATTSTSLTFAPATITIVYSDELAKEVKTDYGRLDQAGTASEADEQLCREKIPQDISANVAEDLVAKCLIAKKDYLRAKAVLVALSEDLALSDEVGDIDSNAKVLQGQLALVEENLGDLTNARTNIESAETLSGGFDPAIHRDYLRLDKVKVAREQAQYLADQHAYWDSLSSAQRVVLTAHGGPRRDAVEPGQPCHVEEFDSAAGHEETWWYCIGDTYNEAYTFMNGALISHYRP